MTSQERDARTARLGRWLGITFYLLGISYYLTTGHITGLMIVIVVTGIVAIAIANVEAKERSVLLRQHALLLLAVIITALVTYAAAAPPAA
ncbi:MAG: hypothetical protein AAF581_06575 [Planctomycetota bacterium]